MELPIESPTKMSIGVPIELPPFELCLVNPRILENGEKQYLAHYADKDMAPAYLPEPAIPASLIEKFNPPQDILQAMPEGERSVSFDWSRQEFVGKYKDHTKVFPLTKWQDKKEGAIKAARTWLIDLRG